VVRRISTSPSVANGRATRCPLSWLILVAFGFFCPSARANDSAAELSVGGLTFTRSADVSMESEELFISLQDVIVRYRFLNLAPTSVTLTVAFPLPDVDLSDPDTNYAFPVSDPVNFVGFQTKVDGAPVKFDVHQRALLGGKDVTETIRAAGLALLPIGSKQTLIDALPAATREKLLTEGLLAQSGTNERGDPIYDGTWTVKTAMVRNQTFPPGQAVSVEHRYRTSLGSSPDTILRKGLRQNKAMEAEFERYRNTYCVPDELLRGLDKVAGADIANSAHIQERRISYILKTGANWSGPIRDFRLVVDKGRPDRLLSFCMDNVTKISPTSFEVRAKDFVPDRDLKILIVGKFD
jgi:hypothetical protein